MRCVHVAIQKEAEALRAMAAGGCPPEPVEKSKTLRELVLENIQRVTPGQSAVNNPVQADVAARAVVTPRWQVYVRIPGTPRVLYYGEDLEGIEAVNVRSEPDGRVVMTLEVVVPPDTFIQFKGVDNDYRTRKG
jgi:hypothetical protein